MGTSKRLIEKKRLYHEDGKIKCTGCHEEKTIDNFHKSKKGMFGFETRCKVCYKNEYTYYTYKKQEYKVKNESLLQIGRKICSKCKVEKDLSDYSLNNKIKCGYNSNCKECLNAVRRSKTNSENYKKDKEREVLLQQGKCHCYVCNVIKSVNEFPKGSKHHYYCKECRREYEKNSKIKKKLDIDPDYLIKKQKREQQLEEKRILKEKKQKLLDDGKKECKKCKTILSLDKFESIRKHYCVSCNPPKDERKYCYSCGCRKELKEMSTEYKCISCSNSKTKKCSCCGEFLHLKKFHNDKRKSSGVDSNCRKCKNRKKYERRKKRRKEDKLYDLKIKLRNDIGKRIKEKGYTKKSTTYEILGITYKGFMLHMENLFSEGMSWDNHGEWHMDHIIPLSSAKTEEELIKLFHYTNYQPLWAEDNLRKSDKIIF